MQQVSLRRPRAATLAIGALGLAAVLAGGCAPAPAPAPGGRCHPNYSPCVPVASDVDCAGGSGNGPAYVTGPVRVLGADPYDLDRDGDGIGCED